jgi:iron complex transport system substrate-binding protein
MRVTTMRLRAAALLCACALASGLAAADRADTQRIVSVGGDVTEILYALGAGEHVVATDTTSLYPPEALETPKVGYARTLAAEGILSLRPTLVIASGDAGPPEALDQLRDAGVAVRVLPRGHSVANIYAKIGEVAAAIGDDARAAPLVADVERRMEAAQRTVARAHGCPRVLFLLNIDAGAPIAAGSDTGADAIIRLAGGCNVFGAEQGYKPLSVEAAVAAAPEVILVMQQRLDDLGGIERVLENPALRLTPAAREKRVVAMDGLYLLGFGPRTPDAVLDLARLLHGDLAGDA